MVSTITTILPIIISALKQSSAVISEINCKCQTQGLPPAFQVNGVLIRGNTDYRLEGFGVNVIPLALTFWVHYKPDSPAHVSLGKFSVPIATLEIINGIPSGDLSGFKTPLNSIQFTSDDPHPRSYLEDESVVLKRGSFDQVGASRYNKPANVPATYVQCLQEDLTQFGFSLGECDGAFGEKTAAALKEFQAVSTSQNRSRDGCSITVTPTYYGSVNGICDAATRKEIKLWLAQKYQKPSLCPPPWVAPEVPKPTPDIPFAESTASTRCWPIQTKHPNGRQVAYEGICDRHDDDERRFLAPRSGRYHAGIDLWGEPGDIIVACEDGTIVNHYPFFSGTDALLVQTNSGLVINYGEVKANSWQEFGLDIGSHVKAGEAIARVGQLESGASMCHFETYVRGTTQSYSYPNSCPTPPVRLLNPTQYLLHLAAGDSSPEPNPSPNPLRQYHNAFPGGVRWRLTPQGVEIEGSGIERTPGEPITTTRIWEQFGDAINQWASHYQVPCALIIATIATESGGNRSSIREEPGYRSDAETPDQISAGLMQTLISTARDVLQNSSINRKWLLVSSNSIQAGACYIAQHLDKTLFDPPKVACDYNAGSIRQNNGESNRWKMCQYPLGTGEHCDRFVKWFNDAVAVLANHSKRPSIPYEVYLR